MPFAALLESRLLRPACVQVGQRLAEIGEGAFGCAFGDFVDPGWLFGVEALLQFESRGFLALRQAPLRHGPVVGVAGRACRFHEVGGLLWCGVKPYFMRADHGCLLDLFSLPTLAPT